MDLTRRVFPTATGFAVSAVAALRRCGTDPNRPLLERAGFSEPDVVLPSVG